jgi:hypothetical protein
VLKTGKGWVDYLELVSSNNWIGKGKYFYLSPKSTGSNATVATALIDSNAPKKTPYLTEPTGAGTYHSYCYDIELEKSYMFSGVITF